MTISKSANIYRWLRISRMSDGGRQPGRFLPDLRETAYPRYTMRATLSHRRGDKRMEKWLKYV